jgi:putative glutamine amidotransferase
VRRVRPRIGIALALDPDGRLRAGRRTLYADAAYGGAISVAGGHAHFLAPGADPESALGELDALLLPGGDDFPPPRPYPAEVRFRAAAPEQIASDLALAGAALAHGLPVLGICYGMQLLALAAGGALLYDVPSDLPGAAAHRLAPAERHELAIAPGSRLAAIFGAATTLAVNSRHHQGVAQPGALLASAHTPDGLVEAIESPREAAFALGVQWHPEDMDSAHRERIYGALVRAARARI